MRRTYVHESSRSNGEYGLIIENLRLSSWLSCRYGAQNRRAVAKRITSPGALALIWSVGLGGPAPLLGISLLCQLYRDADTDYDNGAEEDGGDE